METQSTQNSLMQLFSSLGLNTDSSLTMLETQSPDDTGFASLLSDYLPEQSTKQSAQLLHSAALVEENIITSELSAGILETGPLAEESLPLMGQALPLNVLSKSNAAGFSSINELSTFAQKGSDNSREQSLGNQQHPLDTEHSLLSAEKAEELSTAQVLEDQGFYAQSLVTSLISNNSTVARTSGAAIAVQTTPANSQQAGLRLDKATAESKSPTAAINTGTSEFDELTENMPARFLGAEAAVNGLKLKRPVTAELLPGQQNMGSLNNPTAIESPVSLALAMNEDPIGQSLDDLIDSEAIEEGELDAEVLTMERKQDDQTLKLSKGQQAWGDALTERITMNAAQDIKQVTIHLDPPELGSLELKMQVNDDQQTQVQVQVQNPQVREALESSAHRLRDMLAAEGLELAEFEVQTDAGQGGQLAGGSDEQAQGQQQDSDTSQGLGEEISIEVPSPKNNNLLDTFV